MALLLWSLVHAPVALGYGNGDPEGERNVASDSNLPQGEGIATKFTDDIESHPDVIFADNFEEQLFSEKWDEVRDDGGKVLSLVDQSEETNVVGRRSLRVKAVLGENTGGGLTKWYEPVDTVFIRFYTKFDSECDYVHHFCTLRANRGLVGGDRWSGFGGAGLKPTGNDRFSTALEPWGNWRRAKPPGKWNFYSYWHEMSASGDGKFWGNSFQPSNVSDIPRDEWICAEFMLKHNTPGKADGEQAFWIDGELSGHWRAINWRKSERLKANAFTLESYITDRWTTNQENVVYFDNVVIAEKYIGPAPQ